jgi:hypothetical protein
MKKKDFVGELLSYGVGYALAVLVFLGLAVLSVLFLIAVAAVSFFDRVLH